ncbi:MAG: OadG family protein [Candidatus Kapabacteria bacterium]|nr:OadG family protein [Candidatus Kapabacteria bacterium]
MMTYEILNGMTKLIAGLSDAGVKSLNSITFDLQNQYMDDATVMSVVGIVIVFAVLTITAFAVAGTAKVIKKIQLRNVRPSEKVAVSSANQEDVSGEINAAISMALHLYFAQVHDQESAILTIDRVPRPYAPWSSKIYNIRKHV